MMKVLIIADARSAHTIRWANALVESGLEITVLTPNTLFDKQCYKNGVDIELLNIPAEHFYYRPPIMKIILYFIRLRLAIIRRRPDIIHIHFMPSAFTNLFYWIGLDNLVVSVWGSDVISDTPDSNTRRFKYKKALLEKAKIITATSSFLASKTKEYCKDQTEIEVIPFGVDLSEFYPRNNLASLGEKITIGFCKALTEKYNPLMQIRAFGQVAKKYKQARYVICGEGHLGKEAKKLVQKMGLSKSVIFKGRVPYKDMPEMVNSFDLMIMASASETFGVAIVEAQACGIPVIVSDLPGVLEAVIPNVTAIIVPRNDEAALANAMLCLLDDRDRMRTMGKEAKKFVKDNFDIRTGVESFVRIYQEISRTRKGYRERLRSMRNGKIQ